jgi:outer membrane protein TolC
MGEARHGLGAVETLLGEALPRGVESAPYVLAICDGGYTTSLFSIVPSVTVAISNSGRVSAGVEAARARTDAALLHYQQTLLTPLQDVSDALVARRGSGGGPALQGAR